MSVMLTGGAGFVGLNLAEQLLAAGENVVTYGLEGPPAAFQAEIKDLSGEIAVEIGDIRDRDAMLRAMTTHDVDRLVHGAAVTAGPRRELTSATQIFEVNLLGTVAVLDTAVEHGIGRVLQLGSGSVYGRRADVPGFLDVVCDVPVPDSMYGISKYAAERTALRYRTIHEADVVVARLGVVFGRWEYSTGQRDTLSVPFQLMEVASTGGHAILAPGLPDDWVYASDVARAVIGLLDAAELEDAVFHIGTGERWSVVGWCEQLQAHFPDFTFEVADDGMQANVGRVTPNRRAPFSVDRMCDQIGFEPEFRARRAMEDYVAWWRRNSSVSLS
jgi:nucleoside-diphosphate-sugar epimerase